MSDGPAVLLVDDDRPLLATMSAGLLAQDSTLTVLTAESAEDALQIIGSAPVSIVVTDLCMPGKDGFWLLAQLQERLPSAPRIVTSSALTPAACYRVERAGVLECLPKPVNSRALYEKITQALGRAGSLRFLRGISPASILQLMELEQKSCVLRVGPGAESGELFVVNGAVHDARAGELRGLEAAFRLLGLRGAQIAIADCINPDLPDVIGMSVTSLIMEAAQRADEQSAQEAADAPEQERPVPRPASADDVELSACAGLPPEDRPEMAKLLARAHALSASDMFEAGYEAMKRGRLELACEMLAAALRKEPENRLIRHNLKVIEKKIAASPARTPAGGTR